MTTAQSVSFWRATVRDIARLRQLNAIHKVIGVGIATILLILVATTTLAVRRYFTELTDAARELRTLDLLLAEETGRSLQSVGLILDTIADQLVGQGQGSPDTFATRASTQDLHDMLRTRVTGVPQLDAISIVDADGRLLNFSRAWPIPSIQLGDREYFQYLRDHADVPVYLSEPVLNRGTGTPTIYLAKRLNGSDGRFLGIILGAIELGYFERLYASLHLEPGSFIALWRHDGVLLTRYPTAKLGQRVSKEAITPPATSWNGVSGVSEKGWTIDGGVPVIRIVAAQTIAGFPAQINIGRNKSGILKDWRREALVVGTFLLIAILCILALMWALVRRFTAYEAVAAAAREREHANAARQTAEDALRQSQKMEAVGQLTGGVAHDFNNLLTVIGASVELLRREGLSEERRARYVEAIADAAGRAAKLTGQLLAFARRQTLKPELFDVVANIRSVAQMIDRLTGPLIRVRTILPDTPCLVHADPNQFDTAIINMAVNARDSMADGGDLTISVEQGGGPPAGDKASAGEGAFVAVSVKDTGHGIPPEMRDRVFEPFFTTKKVGQGTGLGLSQVIGFGKQSGGEVSVESVVGQGATFTLRLPRASDDEMAGRVAKQVEFIPDGHGAHVLIVDDDVEVGRLVAQMMCELKYTSVVATSAEDALKVLTADPEGFDAVFSDVVMSGMDGLALARILRSRFPRLPVLLTTGFSAALVESGKNEFPLLHKPYTMKELARALHEAVSTKLTPVNHGHVPAEITERRRIG